MTTSMHTYIYIYVSIYCDFQCDVSVCVCVCLVCMWAVKTLPAPGVHLAYVVPCQILYLIHIEHPFLLRLTWVYINS